MVRTTVVGVTLALCALLIPRAALAQQARSGIAGVVKDASGAVLPGVTVEAASPALIEKVRTVVTDGEGRYNIVDLRPGSLHGHVHADGLQRLQARRHRADVRLHGDASTRT